MGAGWCSWSRPVPAPVWAGRAWREWFPPNRDSPGSCPVFFSAAVSVGGSRRSGSGTLYSGTRAGTRRVFRVRWQDSCPGSGLPRTGWPIRCCAVPGRTAAGAVRRSSVPSAPGTGPRPGRPGSPAHAVPPAPTRPHGALLPFCPDVVRVWCSSPEPLRPVGPPGEPEGYRSGSGGADG